MAKVSNKEIVAVMEEINENVFETPIEIAKSAKKNTATLLGLVNADGVSLLEWDDSISQENWTTLKALGFPVPKDALKDAEDEDEDAEEEEEEVVKPKKGKGKGKGKAKPKKEVEEDEDEDEDAEEEEEEVKPKKGKAKGKGKGKAKPKKEVEEDEDDEDEDEDDDDEPKKGKGKGKSPKKAPATKEKKVTQTSTIVDGFADGKSKKKIVKALLALDDTKTEKWAENRIKLYENTYGEEGCDDKRVTG